VPGVKTNERPGTRAVLKHYRMSATKARQVLDLIRNKDVQTAHEILRSTPREGARVVDKVLHSAVSNAVEVSRQAGAAVDPDELFVSACYADEGTTIKRWRPRARGRATRIRKRTCHITVIVSRLDDEKIARLRAKRTEATAALRSRRVAASRLRRRGGGSDDTTTRDTATDETFADEQAPDDAVSDDAETVSDEAVSDEDASGETVSGETAAGESDEATSDDVSEDESEETGGEDATEEVDTDESEAGAEGSDDGDTAGEEND